MKQTTDDPTGNDMRMIRKIVTAFALLCTVASQTGCSHIASLFGLSGTYSFSGASIPPNATTFSVAYIPNNTADLPTLSSALTEGLRNRFVSQTKLSQIPENGDLAFEGEISMITDQAASYGAASSDGRPEGATSKRVTVTVQMLFTNAIQPELSFSNRQTFSAYFDYPATSMLPDVESSAVEEIVTALVDNIFNAAVAQW